MTIKISCIAAAIFGLAMQANAQTVKQTQVTPIVNSLQIVVKLMPVTFNYEQDWLQKLNINAKTKSGFNMEELAKNSPQLILNKQLSYGSGKNNTKNATVQQIDLESLIPLLVGSIKEQQLQIEALKREINQLKRKVSK
jgi:hypothetical protein